MIGVGVGGGGGWGGGVGGPRGRQRESNGRAFNSHTKRSEFRMLFPPDTFQITG
jgi:hypothetical protein